MAPTDNLYKFIAITGVALMVFSFVMPYIKLSELDNELITLSGEHEILCFKEKPVSERLSQISEEITEVKQEAGQDCENLDKLNLTKLETLLNRINDAGKQNDDIWIDSMMLATKTKLIAVINTRIKSWRIFLLVGYGVGLAMTYYGFKFWYLRLQRYPRLDNQTTSRF